MIDEGGKYESFCETAVLAPKRLCLELFEKNTLGQTSHRTRDLASRFSRYASLATPLLLRLSRCASLAEAP